MIAAQSKNAVAPAQAGAYLACWFRQSDEMDPSLRWGDGVGLGAGI
jgi:hypothetical protein